MTRTVWSCRAEDSLSCAAGLMWEHDIGSLPVLGSTLGSDHKLVGIVTDRDVCIAAYFAGEPLGAVPVSNAMSTVVFTVEPWERVEVAEELMRAKQVHRLPVLDGGKLVGMIALADIARARASAGRRDAADDVAETLAAITAPRPRPAADPP